MQNSSKTSYFTLEEKMGNVMQGRVHNIEAGGNNLR